MRLIDLTGKKFGRLVIASRAESIGGNTRWNAMCECGNPTVVYYSSLVAGRTQSCGCLEKEVRDKYLQERKTIHVGKRHYFLKVIELTSASHVKVRCVCGNEKIIARSQITSKNNRRRTMSCGCKQVEFLIARTKIHGKTGSPEYIVWSGAKGRCHNPKNRQYANYGARGIEVCERWRNSFEKFLYDMGKRPKGTSLERIDVDKGYSPDNCRWATATEQARNRRNSTPIEIDGVRKSLKEWARIYGISSETIRARLETGWDPKDAVTMPVQKKAGKNSGLPGLYRLIARASNFAD